MYLCGQKERREKGEIEGGVRRVEGLNIVYGEFGLMMVLTGFKKHEPQTLHMEGRRSQRI